LRPSLLVARKMISVQEAAAELLAMKLSRRRLHDYIRYTNPKYKVSWFSETVCAALDQFVEDMQIGKRPVLILAAPPQHGKSEIVSRALPAYLLGRFPEWRIAAASYSSTLASKMAMSVRRNLINPNHQRLFPPLDYKRKYVKDTTLEFTSPTGNGSYIGDGVGGGFTGSSADIFIIDDPIKNAQEALSETTKEGLWEWYQSTAKTRMSENSGLIIMATRWAEDDLSARVEQSLRGVDDRLVNLRFPAINLPGEVGYDPKLPEGPLVPELHSMEQLLEFKSEGSSDYWWAAMFQQSPKAMGGNVFKEFGVQYYLPKDLPAKFDKLIASWDCTFKDTDGTDFVVGQVWGKAGANCYLLAQTRGRLSFSRTVAEVISLKHQWPQISAILIEDKANGPAVIDVLKSSVPGIIAIEPDGSKLARGHAVTAYWEAHNVWLPHADIAPWVVEFVNEVTRFPAAANDDQVDGMTQALRHLYPLRGKLAISQAALNMAMGKR
jgi:predicted phage terminase large subunit-like protein